MFLASLIGIQIPLLGVEGASAIELPESESNLFILDVSGSTNSVELWKNLRVSVISKLNQPFGNPPAKSVSRKLPIDMSITSVSQNSQNSPIFTIVSKSDAKKMWGTVDLVFPKSTESRLERISQELFGENGAWAVQTKIFNRKNLIIPSLSDCRKSVINTINKGPFLRSTDEQNKNTLAIEMCTRLIGITKSLKAADEYFSKPICDKRAVCSDIAGAIYRSTNLAADLAAQRPEKTSGKVEKSELCIAIASDMLNESPGMTSSSILNSKRIALTASTLKEARNAGIEAANAVGINFPANISTRAVMVGIGSGPNPIALERNSFLLAYWQGFWTAAGVKQTNLAQSLNQACS